jgi:hypothetical protein
MHSSSSRIDVGDDQHLEAQQDDAAEVPAEVVVGIRATVGE